MSDNTKTPYVPESYTSLSGVGVQQKLYTRAEVDAEIAAAFEAASKHYIQLYDERRWVCSCGEFISDASLPGAKREAWQPHISSLTPASARAALNGAIAQAYERCAANCGTHLHFARLFAKWADEARKGER